jgi:DNA-binding NarL/FixJ family response regulator
MKNRAERPACLVLRTFDHPELLLEAAPHGAQGFVSRDVALADAVTSGSGRPEADTDISVRALVLAER